MKRPVLYTRLYVYSTSAVLALFYGWPKDNPAYDRELDLLATAWSRGCRADALARSTVKVT